MDPRKINIHDYTYSLPEEKIANYPLAIRDASKLLVYKNGIITEDKYYNIADHLPADSLIVFNNTKVIEARLLFRKPTGGVIEIFCLEHAEQFKDVSAAMMQQGAVLWKCLIGGASKWKHGLNPEKRISLPNEELILHASMRERLADSFIIEFSWTPERFSFAEVLHAAGAIPLPPYIKREAEALDAERYQTIYAKENGSVAAPTAGLHFTENIFHSLESKKIKKTFVTLHVGAGTFKPVKSETIAEHPMHAEFIEADASLIKDLVGSNTIIAVGTTSLRTLETLYWLGVKLIKDPGLSGRDLHLNQWEAYGLPQDTSANMALDALMTWMNKNKLSKLFASTQLLIAPGYTLRIVDILITNFHQPQSTLLLLVASVAGGKWKKIYEYALENDFRFLSYGDGCLIYPTQIV